MSKDQTNAVKIITNKTQSQVISERKKELPSLGYKRVGVGHRRS